MSRTRARALGVVVVCLAACSSPQKPPSASSTGAGALTWTVALLPGGDTAVGAVDTRLCFSGPAPAHVGPENLRALPWLMDLPRPVDVAGRVLGPPLPVDAQGIVTQGLAEHSCVSFSVDIEGAARDIDDRDVAAVVGRAILSSPDAWLWRPKPWPGDVVGRLIVDERGAGSGDGVVTGPGSLDRARLAVPFARDVDGNQLVPRSSFALQCFALLGDVEVSELEWHGVTLQVARVDDGGGLAALSDPRLREWLQVAVDDVAVPLPGFPVSQVLVLVVPGGHQRAVEAGFLGRGGGTSALFLVGRAPLARVAAAASDDPAEAALLDDDGRWVLTHELAHALLPPVVRGDAWLNEGLTTWHQEVLPAAAGRRSRTDAQGQLEIGFHTGRARAAQDGFSVERSCAEMDRFGSYQHCYWAGARLIDLLAQEVGDDGVFALVRALHGASPTDGVPLPALRLLARAAEEPAAAAPARALVRLWKLHRGAPFPDPPEGGSPDVVRSLTHLPGVDDDAPRAVRRHP